MNLRMMWAASDSETAMDRQAECRRALSFAAELIAEVAASPAQRALIDTALIGLDGYVRRAADKGAYVHSIALPLAVHAAITGSEGEAAPLAAACGLVNLAIDLFDDLADGDRQAHWAKRSFGEMSLAAATILGALPPLILARLDVEPERRARMQEILALGGLRASAGQQEDLRQTGNPDVTVEDVEAAVTGKTGERYAAYCELAAEMAGADATTKALYAAYGRDIGVAVQLLSDCHDVMTDPDARDLAHGTRTLPIAVHLSRLDDGEQARFLELLDRARTDREAQASVRKELLKSAAIRRVVIRAQVCRARARRLADEAGAKEPGRGWLMALAASGLDEPDPDKREEH
jgi:geranylgeranyl pyrophosphate synthase